MNWRCFDYLHKSATVSAFTKTSVEGNKLIASGFYFGKFLKKKKAVEIVLYVTEGYIEQWK